MRNSTTLFFFCALFLISGYHAANVSEQISMPAKAIDSKTKEATTSSTSTTTVSTTTSSSTESSTTTTSTTTTPSTTTTIPSTTTTTTTTTTEAPITPVPDPEVGKWNVTGTETILVDMAAQISVTYNTTTNKTISNWKINVPKNATANGTFSPNYEQIKLSWKSNGVGYNYVALNFTKDNTSKTYDLDSVDVSIEPEDLPNIDQSSPLKLSHKKKHFNVTLDNSYRCVKLQHFNLTKDDDTLMGNMKVTNLQFQAFKTDSNKAFGVPEDCAFDTPDIVPIAVGCILAGLVVIILVGYLITRRRSQARGYLSM